MIKKMVGKAPHIYFRLSWQLLCPLLVLVRLYMISNTWICSRSGDDDDDFSTHPWQLCLIFYVFGRDGMSIEPQGSCIRLDWRDCLRALCAFWGVPLFLFLESSWQYLEALVIFIVKNILKQKKQNCSCLMCLQSRLSFFWLSWRSSWSPALSSTQPLAMESTRTQCGLSS